MIRRYHLALISLSFITIMQLNQTQVEKEYLELKANLGAQRMQLEVRDGAHVLVCVWQGSHTLIPHTYAEGHMTHRFSMPCARENTHTDTLINTHDKDTLINTNSYTRRWTVRVWQRCETKQPLNQELHALKKITCACWKLLGLKQKRVRLGMQQRRKLCACT